MSMSSSTEAGAQQLKTDAEAGSRCRSLQNQNAAQKYVADVSASILAEVSPSNWSQSLGRQSEWQGYHHHFIHNLSRRHQQGRR